MEANPHHKFPWPLGIPFNSRGKCTHSSLPFGSKGRGGSRNSKTEIRVDGILKQARCSAQVSGSGAAISDDEGINSGYQNGVEAEGSTLVEGGRRQPSNPRCRRRARFFQAEWVSGERRATITGWRRTGGGAAISRQLSMTGLCYKQLKSLINLDDW
jgi:hypothetical protein